MILPSLEDMWAACGGVGEFRLVVGQKGQSPVPEVLRAPFAVVGSRAGCDVVLKDKQVSRRHAYLQIIAGRLWCIDLESRTGIRLACRRKKHGWVDPREGVQIGGHFLRSMEGELLAAEVEDNDNQPVTALAWDQDSLPSLTLEFLNAMPDSGDPPVWRLDRLMTFVGQSQFCKVRFACPSISRYHASLLRTPLGVWIFDLVSREGIFLNGKKVRWARLHDGDQLQLGKFQIGIRAAKARQPLNHLAKFGTLSVPAASGVGPLVPELSLPLKPAPAGPLPAMNEPNAPTDGMSALANLPAPLLGAFPLSPTPSTHNSPIRAMPPDPSVLQNLMNQFSVMQQQMYEQFQNSTFMMMQMFCSLQKDQFDMVREELDEIRDLNREINSLQAELAKSRIVTTTSAVGVTNASLSFGPPAAGASTADNRSGGGAPNWTIPLSEKASLPRQVISARDPATSQVQPVVSTPAAFPPVDGDGKQPAKQEDMTAKVAQKGPEVHDWVCQRFTELQNERQNRWQRLMSKLLGK